MSSAFWRHTHTYTQFSISHCYPESSYNVFDAKTSKRQEAAREKEEKKKGRTDGQIRITMELIIHTMSAPEKTTYYICFLIVIFIVLTHQTSHVCSC